MSARDSLYLTHQAVIAAPLDWQEWDNAPERYWVLTSEGTWWLTNGTVPERRLTADEARTARRTHIHNRHLHGRISLFDSVCAPSAANPARRRAEVPALVMVNVLGAAALGGSLCSRRGVDSSPLPGESITPEGRRTPGVVDIVALIERTG